MSSMRGVFVLLALMLTMSCGETAGVDEADTGTETGSASAGDTDSFDTSSETESQGPSDGSQCLDDPLHGLTDPYPEGIEGAPCDAMAPCPGSAVCSATVFPASLGFSGTKCYPACASSDPASPCCATGDRCVALSGSDGDRACLAVGHARKQGLALRIWPAGSVPDHTGVALVAVDVVANGKKIPLNMAYAVEDTADVNGDGVVEPVIIVELEGVAGPLGTWVLQITVRRDRWTEGELEARRGDPETGFDAALTKWVGQKMTLEAILTEGSFRLSSAGEPCAAPPCNKAVLSFDFELVSISAVLGL